MKLMLILHYIHINFKVICISNHMQPFLVGYRREALTHWGRMTHICVSDLTSIGSENGLLPGRRQAIIRTNAGILLIRPLGTNFSEFLVETLIFSFKKMCLKVSSAKRRPFCLGLNELMFFTCVVIQMFCKRVCGIILITLEMRLNERISVYSFPLKSYPAISNIAVRTEIMIIHVM